MGAAMAARKLSCWRSMSLVWLWIVACSASSCRSTRTIQPGIYRPDDSGVAAVFLEGGEGWLDNPGGSRWRQRVIPFEWDLSSDGLKWMLYYPTGTRETVIQKARKIRQESFELWSVVSVSIEDLSEQWDWVQWSRIGEPPTECVPELMRLRRPTSGEAGPIAE